MKLMDKTTIGRRLMLKISTSRGKHRLKKLREETDPKQEEVVVIHPRLKQEATSTNQTPSS